MLAMQSCVSTVMAMRRALAAHMQPGFDALLVGFDVFLEFARQKFAHLSVEAVHVGNERQQPHQHQQQDG